MPEITNTQNQPLIYVPLFVIVVLSMLKDYMEDYKRKKSDREENNREVDVFSESKFEKALWKNLLIGEIIKVVKLYFVCFILKRSIKMNFCLVMSFCSVAVNPKALAI